MFELNAPVGGGNRQIAPEGTHVARCYQIIDLGTSEQGGQFPGKKRKVQFLFELPNELAVFDESKGEQPYYCRSMYTLSMNEKAILRKDVEGWTGKRMTDAEAAKFNIFKLLGTPCMVSIVHVERNGVEYANINSISKLAKGLECPAQINPSLAFSPQQPDLEAFEKLPEFIKEKIQMSDEWQGFQNSRRVTSGAQPKAQPKRIDEPEEDFFGNLSKGELPWD